MCPESAETASNGQKVSIGSFHRKKNGGVLNDDAFDGD
jgi:hypothetical protein